MSVTSDISDHHTCMIQQSESIQHNYKLINQLTYNHYNSLSECSVEKNFILLIPLEI
jgi:hypothetical protein